MENERDPRVELAFAVDLFIRSNIILTHHKYILQSSRISNDISLYDQSMHSTGHIFISAYYCPKIEICWNWYPSGPDLSGEPRSDFDTHKVLLDTTDPQCFEHLLGILNCKDVHEFVSKWPQN